MTLAFPRGLRPVVLVALAACSAAVEAVPAAPPTPAAADGLALRFETEGTLRLKPGAYATLSVVAPPRIGRVRLALDGSYEDASLVTSEANVASGRATATLRAPSVAATFTVRASADGAAEAILRVAVSAQGFGSLRVTPRYVGRRHAESFYASAIVKGACAELGTGDVKDGSPVDVGDARTPIVLTDVPAEGHVAVQARVARYAVGCVDVEQLVAGAERAVTVEVRDLPMDLAQASYEARLTLEPDADGAAAWDRLIDAAAISAADAFAPQSADEGRLWLDTVRERMVPAAARGEVDTSRAQGGWDAKVATWLQARPPSLRSRASTWLAAGKADVRGPIAMRITPSASAKNRAVVTPSAFGAFPASLVKVAARGEFEWKGDPEDTVHLAGALALLPSELVAAAADARARRDVPAAPGVGDALGAQLDCASLAAQLVGPGTAYAQCGAACLTAHLVGALGTLWTDAHDASQAAGDEVSIDLTASARAELTELPRPERFVGTWLGAASASVGDLRLKGAFTGERSP